MSVVCSFFQKRILVFYYIGAWNSSLGCFRNLCMNINSIFIDKLCLYLVVYPPKRYIFYFICVWIDI